MDIRFVSTLTAEDESQFAPALLRSVTALLDTVPIAYTLRIETLDGEVFQHTHPATTSQVSPVEARTASTASVRRLADS